MSDRALLNPAEPDGSENRRIELFVLTTPAAKVLETFFGDQQPGELDKARDEAIFNQPVKRGSAVSQQQNMTISVTSGTLSDT